MRNLILAALIASGLAGCDEQYGLRVHNQGASAAELLVRYTERDDSTESYVERTHIKVLGAGEQERTFFPTAYLRVRITRVSDGASLFSDNFTSSDYDGEHGTIEVSVFP